MADRSINVMGGLHTYVVYVFILSSAQYVMAKDLEMKICTINSKVHSQGICGSQIPQLLSTVCGRGGYVDNSKRSEKPSSPPVLDMDAKTFLDLSQQNAQSKGSSLFDFRYNKRDASSFLDKRSSYYRVGISCECCYHKCSIGDFASYCKDPEKAMAALMHWTSV